jgi:hypothetical protein
MTNHLLLAKLRGYNISDLSKGIGQRYGNPLFTGNGSGDGDTYGSAGGGIGCSIYGTFGSGYGLVIEIPSETDYGIDSNHYITGNGFGMNRKPDDETFIYIFPKEFGFFQFVLATD